MIQQSNGWAAHNRSGLGEQGRMEGKRGVGGEPSEEHRAEVLLEKISSDVQTVLEGHTGLVRQLGQLEKQVAAGHADLKQFMKDGFEKVWQDFDGVDKRFAKVDTRFDEVTSRLDALTSRFDVHEKAHAN